MLELMSVALLTSNFITYPAFGDSLTGVRGPMPGRVRIEAAIDKGPIIELIVRCPVGTGILSYSKLERLYCSSKQTCDARIAVAISDTCR